MQDIFTFINENWEAFIRHFEINLQMDRESAEKEAEKQIVELESHLD